MSESMVFKAKIVHLILSKKPDEALECLSDHYNIETPKLKVGMPKAHGKATGCYVSSSKTIFLSDGENLYNPYLILHEFYHHLRTDNGKHRGTEKLADKYAEEFVQAYTAAASST